MKTKIPYTLNLLFPIIGWSLLCSALAYTLVITIANFKNPLAGMSFEVLTPLYVIIFYGIAFLRYWGISFWSGNDIRIVNKNVSFKGINRDLSTEEIKNTFDALIAVSKGSPINVLASGSSIIVLTILTEWFNLASNFELFIILCGGAVALFFSAAFATFFCQQAMFPIIKECRRMLVERGESIVNDTQLSGIGAKFYFLFWLPFFMLLIVLIAVYPFNINVAIICFIGLGMTFIIDRVLFSYLSNALKEIDMFAKELPMGERAAFVTGSLDKEIVNLSQSLNDASEKIYAARNELENSQKEMGRRVKELEKFFELTVNREIKMMELKKELKKIKGNVQEDDA